MVATMVATYSYCLQRNAHLVLLVIFINEVESEAKPEVVYFREINFIIRMRKMIVAPCSQLCCVEGEKERKRMKTKHNYLPLL